LDTGASDEQFRELLDYTKALLFAADAGNVKEIGRQLKKRRRCLDAIRSAGGVGGSNTETRKALLNEIALCDGKASRKISELKKKSGQAMSDYTKKSVGMLKYSKEKNNFLSGQFVDKSD
jgi:hypothetical protein